MLESFKLTLMLRGSVYLRMSIYFFTIGAVYENIEGYFGKMHNTCGFKKLPVHFNPAYKKLWFRAYSILLLLQKGTKTQLTQKNGCDLYCCILENNFTSGMDRPIWNQSVIMALTNRYDG